MQIRVSNDSPVKALAGSILSAIECADDEGSTGTVTLLSIGPHALNQAVKALCVAVKMAAYRNIDLGCVPHFVDVPTERGTMAAIAIELEWGDLDVPTASSE